MTKDIMLFVLFLAVLLLCAWPLGKYMARVFNYEKTCGERFFAPLENIFYKMAKVDPRTEMPWKEYCLNLIIFNALGMLSLFVLQLTQAFLPLNPQQLPNVETWHLAFNTAASFMTNTCLLYTSDAADDLLCVNLGGRRIHKKKNKQYIPVSYKQLTLPTHRIV